MNRTGGCHDVIIIGAGPAGLSLGYYFEKFGIDYSILEKEELGFSWKSMPEKLFVISPWWTNLLPNSVIGFTKPFAEVNKTFYYDYLKCYAEKNSIQIEPYIQVKDLKSEKNGFRLETSNGVRFARIVICATGYFSNPYIPALPEGNDGSLLELHAGDYFSAKQIAMDYPNTKKILLVGKRVTAGQLMIELNEFGFEVDISCRSELILRKDHTFIGKLRAMAYFFYEAIKMRFQPHLKISSYVDMGGGQTGQLLESGKVVKQAKILGISEGFVLFADETKSKYDLVIYATGYRAALSYMNDCLLALNIHGEPETVDMENIKVPNIFFIGLDNLVNFRSRYLRGIASDAKRLAILIRSRLNGST